ncbi:MAG: MBL fold metallo-hydrolase [Candidatus Pacearchaeota archaeon]
MFDYNIIGSSSKGNCYILKTTEDVLILECGLHYRDIYKALDFNVSNVAGCLITHEHKDHSKEAKMLVSKMGINVFASSGTLEAIGIKDHHRAKTVKAKEQFTIGKYTILPFDVQHDAKEPLGYLIQHPEIGKLLFVTDTYYIKYKFNELNYIMIECNYSKEIIDRASEEDRIHPALRRRLLTSHLSIENLKQFLDANDLSKVKEIILLHLSDSNSNEKQFINEVQKLTGLPTKTIFY